MYSNLDVKRIASGGHGEIGAGLVKELEFHKAQTPSQVGLGIGWIEPQ